MGTIARPGPKCEGCCWSSRGRRLTKAGKWCWHMHAEKDGCHDNEKESCRDPDRDPAGAQAKMRQAREKTCQGQGDEREAQEAEAGPGPGPAAGDDRSAASWLDTPAHGE